MKKGCTSGDHTNRTYAFKLFFFKLIQKVAKACMALMLQDQEFCQQTSTCLSSPSCLYKLTVTSTRSVPHYALIKLMRKYKKWSAIWIHLLGFYASEDSTDGTSVPHTFLQELAGHFCIPCLLQAALPFQEATLLRHKEGRLWHGGGLVLLFWAVLSTLCGLHGLS